MPSSVNYTNALLDFQKIRRKAAFQSILGHLTGKRHELLSYEDVRKQLRAIEGADRHLLDIPLDAIVGSVNRYSDFNRDFLPKRSISAERWARVKAATQDMLGLPPIEVYRIGDVYFVLDGNHRVSVARQVNARFIQAYVKDVHARISLTSDVQASDLIVKSEYADFLEKTDLNVLRPQCNLETTSPGRHPFLLQQIEAVHFNLESQKKTNIPYQQAVLYWYDQIFFPIIEIIREDNLLEFYPDRTETDLFVWILKYQNELKKGLGWNISVESTVKRLGRKSKPTQMGIWKYVTENLIHSKRKGSLSVGEWRRQRLSSHTGRLFDNLIVVLTDSNPNWSVLNYGVYIAQNEGSEIYGLHITHPKKPLRPEDKNRITQKFENICKEANVPGELIFITSVEIEKNIINRASYTNLLLVPLNIRKKREHGIDTGRIVRQYSRPILFIPDLAPPPITRVLLAYDGSPKSNEALFLAAYMTKFWEVEIVVLSMIDSHGVTENTLFYAYEYLRKYGVSGDFIKAEGPPSLAVETFAVEDGCDLILTGGYSHGILRKKITGSLVDDILGGAKFPIMICE